MDRAKQILIMESDPVFCQQFQTLIQNDGMSTHCVKSAIEALNAFEQRDYCLAVLEIQRIGISNIKTIHRMRELKFLPILAITDVADSKEKIQLFQTGVHAHMEKPVDVEVCIAQAHSLIRLFEGKFVQDQKGDLHFGTELVIRPWLRRVFVFEKPLELTRKEFDLMYFLAQNPCQVFSYEQLYFHVWKDEYTFGGENTVKSHIATLRKKLGGMEKDCIQNEWGVGYRFIPPNCIYRNSRL